MYHARSGWHVLVVVVAVCFFWRVSVCRSGVNDLDVDVSCTEWIARFGCCCYVIFFGVHVFVCSCGRPACRQGARQENR